MENTIHKTILYKKENLRIDQLIINCIQLMDNILQKDAHLFLYITPYRVLPLSNNDGFILMVDNAETIYDIKHKYKFSIQNYILEKNVYSDSKPIGEIREIYMKSCAAYCVISYLLGIGDRHLENILITHHGILFHIDFDYILGYEPKILSPEIRITPEMIDAMGGPNSKYYTEFKKICTQAYNCIRRHFGLFYEILSLLYLENSNKQFTEEYVTKQLISRFIPGENYENAELQFITRVAKSSSDTRAHKFIDYWHYHANERNSIPGIIDTVYNYITG